MKKLSDIHVLAIAAVLLGYLFIIYLAAASFNPDCRLPWSRTPRTNGVTR
jgi:hypothetical protein